MRIWVFCLYPSFLDWIVALNPNPAVELAWNALFDLPCRRSELVHCCSPNTGVNMINWGLDWKSCLATCLSDCSVPEAHSSDAALPLWDVWPTDCSILTNKEWQKCVLASPPHCHILFSLGAYADNMLWTCLLGYKTKTVILCWVTTPLGFSSHLQGTFCHQKKGGKITTTNNNKDSNSNQTM